MENMKKEMQAIKDSLAVFDSKWIFQNSLPKFNWLKQVKPRGAIHCAATGKNQSLENRKGVCVWSTVAITKIRIES